MTRRRDVLKGITVAGAAGAVWKKPVVDGVALPAHANTTCCEANGTEWDLLQYFPKIGVSTELCTLYRPFQPLSICNSLGVTARLVVVNTFNVDDDLEVDGEIVPTDEPVKCTTGEAAGTHGAHDIEADTVLKSGIAPCELTVIDLIDNQGGGAGIEADSTALIRLEAES